MNEYLKRLKEFLLELYIDLDFYKWWFYKPLEEKTWSEYQKDEYDRIMIAKTIEFLDHVDVTDTTGTWKDDIATSLYIGDIPYDWHSRLDTESKKYNLPSDVDH